MNLKYVMLEYNIPILFHPVIEHRNMMELKTGFGIEFGKITSAGFVQIFVGDDYGIAATAYGESVSLGVKTNLDDSEIITTMLRKE